MRNTVFKLAAFLSCSCVWSQQSPKPDVDWAAIQKQIDSLEAAVQAHDIAASAKLSQQLWHVTSQEKIKQSPTAADRLVQAEARQKPNDPTSLPYMAMLAVQAGLFDKAQLYASQTLQTPSAGYDSVHSGNVVLGLVALNRDEDLAAAKTYLLAAGKAKGSTTMDRWGPNLALAKALLDKGQNETVLEYFKSCKSFVTKNPKLDDWIAILKGGRPPDLTGEYLWFQ